ncbi:FAD-dependent oxidoreductase [Gloeobacter kilaueensis]|uniref:FAD-dependent pyridine nucleotide-disulfide oxidoreductase n=1 Tax=Gloeobacter kilaueensis (strain ATCC BAA-2537 / CCAP 1431/1 / ULC 316 / JS1) TaxID=1183438 RepID=U5QFE7_GLOK1|nr:FAD-dependent oxidoreductase [Gloeobacter kilaueensis]AGY56395.1 FAD-dependent pyridine nucleotide-disulfide oxidoreductase [Gloeobacter kilaueensis JS1]
MASIEVSISRSELSERQPKQIKVGDTDVLLVQVNGTVHALGAYCTHYGAPLAEGVVSEGHIVCPWHNACFALATGRQLEPPGLDSLEHYQTRSEGDAVIVSVPEGATGQCTPPMAKQDREADARTFVVLGTGAAGAAAVEMLRQEGFKGRIVFVGKEQAVPYDRTWLSKDYLMGKVEAEQMPLRSPDFYREHDIELHFGKAVSQVDAQTKTLHFEDGTSLIYDALLVATGGKPRQLSAPGADLGGVFTLRSFKDSQQILAMVKADMQVVVVGSSFIGMETASALRQRGANITVVSPEQVPFEPILGERIGRVFQQVHAEQGVAFRLGAKVARLEGESAVEAVVLEHGERLPAEMVIVGVGVAPATDLLSGVTLHEKDKSVLVDDYLLAADGLYAAGDIARYPDGKGGTLRIEHWRIAAQQGHTAARNMLGRAERFKAAPVFWTLQFEFPLRYVGHASEWDDILFDGEPEKRQFMAFFVRENRVVAVAASQRDTEMAAIEELARLDRLPPVERIRRGELNVLDYFRSATQPRGTSG